MMLLRADTRARLVLVSLVAAAARGDRAHHSLSDSSNPSLGGPSESLRISFESADRGFALQSLAVAGPSSVTQFIVPPRPWVHGNMYDSLWTATVANTTSVFDLGSGTAGSRSWRALNDHALELRWDNVSLPTTTGHTADVVLTVTLSADGSQVSWDPVFTNRAADVGLMEFSLWVARLSTSTPDTDVLFVPAGFGALFTNPSQTLANWPMPGATRHPNAYKSNYPETLWQLQYHGFFSGQSGLYFGIHDPAGSMKTLTMGRPDLVITPAETTVDGGNTSTVIRYLLRSLCIVCASLCVYVLHKCFPGSGIAFRLRGLAPRRRLGACQRRSL